MRAVAVLLGLLLPLGATAAGADVRPAPGLGVRLLDAPTARASDPRARVYVVDRIAPGAVFTRHVEVSNGDAGPIDVLTYPAAAIIDGGSFTVANRGAPGEIPTWTSVVPASLHLAAYGRSTLTVTVRVPSDAPSGEFYGAVVAERPPPPGTRGAAVAVRAAVRIYLSVGEGGEPRSDFAVQDLTAERDRSGRPVVQAQVRNTGGRALDLSGTLSLGKGPGGLSAGPFPVKLGTTLGLGQTAPLAVLLDPALPDGPWQATLAVRSGSVAHTVQATLVFPARAGQAQPPVVPRLLPPYRRQGVVGPAATVVLGLVALALLLALLHRRRTQHR